MDKIELKIFLFLARLGADEKDYHQIKETSKYLSNDRSDERT